MEDHLIWKKRLEAIASDYSHALSEFSQEEMQMRPRSKSWSAAEVLQHVILVNESYFLTFDRLLNRLYQQPLIGRIDFLARLYGRMILKSVSPDRKRKYRTVTIWEPEFSDVQENISGRFFEVQKKLIDYFRKLERLILIEYVINSPANRNIVYGLDQAIEIIMRHEERHLNQIRNIHRSLKEAKKNSKS